MKINKGKQPRPRRVLIYGDNGIGKSTLAASFPKPIVINLEDGVTGIDIDHTDRINELAEARNVVDWLLENENSYATVIIDTADWLEKLIFADVARRAGKPTVEEIGYGKGYESVEATWRLVLIKLSKLWERNKHIVFVCHSKVAKFKNPEGDAYDFYSPALHDKGSEIIQQWCDEVLFAHYKTFTRQIDEGFGSKRTVAIGGTDRVLRCQEAASHVAKNRCGMPAEIAMDWDELSKYFGAAAVAAAGNIAGVVVDGSSKQKKGE